MSTEALHGYRTEHVSCALCGTDAPAPFLSAREDYTGRPGLFHMVRCTECGLVYQNPRIPIENIKDFYDDNYISHRKQTNLGPLAPLFDWAMGRHDARKLALVSRFVNLTAASRVLDVGCAAGGFLKVVARRFGSEVHGLDFKDLSGLPGLDSIRFHHGLFCEEDFGTDRFDLITMWHFLEHDYEPRASLVRARDLLTDDGVLLIEVPDLDSLTFRLFGRHWPGVQAPQHTMMLSREAAAKFVHQAGLELVAQLSYGAFPPNFYLFLGAFFKLNRARGIDTRKLMLPYFLSQLLLLPVTLLEKRLSLCMQTLVCRKGGPR